MCAPMNMTYIYANEFTSFNAAAAAAAATAASSCSQRICDHFLNFDFQSIWNGNVFFFDIIGQRSIQWEIAIESHTEKIHFLKQ